MVAKAKATKERYFGKNIYLFTPQYIANHCDNNCVYCGFKVGNDIKRAQLDENDIIKELENIAKTGLKEILILTGESQTKTPLNYIANACRLAKKYFDIVGVGNLYKYKRGYLPKPIIEAILKFYNDKTVRYLN